MAQRSAGSPLPAPSASGHRLRLPFSQEQWRRRTEWPVTGAAIVFLITYSWSVIGDLRGEAGEAAEWVMWSIWIVFAIDYALNLVTAERRRHWLGMVTATLASWLIERVQTGSPMDAAQDAQIAAITDRPERVSAQLARLEAQDRGPAAEPATADPAG